MRKRGWGALSAQEWGGESFPELKLNKPGQGGEGGSGGVHPATRSGKACESGRGRKTPQEREKDPLPT
jgi:hypothetical protein